MYITPHLNVVKDFWKKLFMFNRFILFLNFKFHKFQIACFVNVVINKRHLNFFFIKILL
jgi:hypothetical protein